MCLREEIDDGLPAALVYETRPGALREPVANTIVEELRSTTAVVVVVDHQQRRRHLPGKRSVHAGETALGAPHFLRQKDRPATDTVQRSEPTR